MKEMVQHIAVVNDAAERGIKDIQEYANASDNETYRNQIIVVANDHRHKIPKF